jgi:hypothetical protein
MGLVVLLARQEVLGPSDLFLCVVIVLLAHVCAALVLMFVFTHSSSGVVIEDGPFQQRDCVGDVTGGLHESLHGG